MKKSAILLCAAFVTVAHADILLTPPGSPGPVIVELQPNTAWRQAMPDYCRITFNYTTGQVVVEQRPDVSSTKDRAPCARPWAENLATFWKGIANLVSSKPEPTVGS
jgi:hypothetical protein